MLHSVTKVNATVIKIENPQTKFSCMLRLFDNPKIDDQFTDPIPNPTVAPNNRK